MIYEVSINNFLECLDEVRVDNSNQMITIEENEQELIITQEQPTSYKHELERLNKIVEKVVYNKSDYSIKNTQELFDCWKKEKKEIIFNDGGEEYVTSLMRISKYLEETETLSIFVKNYGVTPIVLMTEQNKNINDSIMIKEFEMFNLFNMGKALFDIDLKGVRYKELKTFELVGKVSEKYDIVAFKKKLKDKLNLLQSDQINLDINLIGRYSYENNILKGLEFNAIIKVNELYKFRYEISINSKKEL